MSISRIFTTALFMAALSCMLSCSKDVELDSFSIDEEYLGFSVTTEVFNVSIPVSTNLSASMWSVESSDPGWCIVTQENGGKSIKLYVIANQEPEARSAKVEVKSPVRDYSINVVQLGYGRSIVLHEESTTVPSDGKQIEIKVVSNVDYKVTIEGGQGWITETEGGEPSRGLAEKIHYFDVSEQYEFGNRYATITFQDLQDASLKEVYTLTQLAREGSIDDVEITVDKLIMPTGGFTAQFQPGYPIEKLWDGDKNMGDKTSIYHSPWSPGTTFPVTLDIYFDGTEDIDYFIYYPVGDESGSFGVVDIYYTTQSDRSGYVLIDENYDFGGPVIPYIYTFSQTLEKPYGIRLVVKSSTANNVVAGKEIEFYKKSDNAHSLNDQLLTVFTDLTCSQVRNGVTDAQINALPGYFANIAFTIKQDRYDQWEKTYRIQEYAPHSKASYWASIVQSKLYSNLNNPIGIYVEAGEEIVVLVGETHGYSIALQVVAGTNTVGSSYTLKEGVNKVTVTNEGLLYLIYMVPDLKNSKAKPVKVHVPLKSGRVEGYWDAERDDDAAYMDILGKGEYSVMTLKGRNTVHTYRRVMLYRHMSTAASDYINLWDNLVDWTMELSGVDKYRPTEYNNRLHVLTTETGSWMWSANDHVGVSEPALAEIMPYSNMFNSIWGPAHEIGHAHQSAINWVGCTEASNNLFSNVARYNTNKKASNGLMLQDLAELRYTNGRAWAAFQLDRSDYYNMYQRMYWQLWHYFNICTTDKTDFWPKLFTSLRTLSTTRPDGQKQIDFIRYASDAARLDFSDFFEVWGMLTEVDRTVSDYGDKRLTVTSSMIADVKQHMSQYPKAPAIQYLEDRNSSSTGLSQSDKDKLGNVGYWTQFRDKPTVPSNVSYSVAGTREFTMYNGTNAVAFEVRDATGANILFFSNFTVFTVPDKITLPAGYKIMAVQYDGTRKEAAKQ